MPKIRVGNKQNAALNGEYAGHVRKDGKKITSGKRRTQDKKIIKDIKDDLVEVITSIRDGKPLGKITKHIDISPVLANVNFAKLEESQKRKIKYTQKEINDIVYNFPRKYKYGFTFDEIKELLQSFPYINMDKYDNALSHITAIYHDKQTLIYPQDVMQGIICGLENRDINEFEFD